MSDSYHVPSPAARLRLRALYRTCLESTLALWNAQGEIEAEWDTTLDFMREAIDGVCVGLDTPDQITDAILDEMIDEAAKVVNT